MPDYGASGGGLRGIWVKLGGIGEGNSRKPLFRFRLLGKGFFAKVSGRLKHHLMFQTAFVSFALRIN